MKPTGPRGWSMPIRGHSLLALVKVSYCMELQDLKKVLDSTDSTTTSVSSIWFSRASSQHESESKSKLLCGWHIMASNLFISTCRILRTALHLMFHGVPKARCKPFSDNKMACPTKLFLSDVCWKFLYIYPDHFQPSIHWFNGIQW